ncbi:MAG: hypothetical protein K8F27_15665 [Sulfuricellaceae bacterium]|nr:hypothetical protein [Sulfuricellaceae bacterium]
MKKHIGFWLGAALLIWSVQAGATVTNLLDMNQWKVYGTAGLQGGTLTVGDNIGYDPSDSDKDGNPYDQWFQTGQGQDYDEAVTVNEFTSPLTVAWTGCFPMTQYGYNNIVLGQANPNFTGAAGSKQYPIQQDLGFTSRWDYGATLNTFVNNSGNYTVRQVSGATLANNNFCGDYKIVWANDKAQFYFNGNKVDEQNYPYTGPVKLLIRSFDRPHTLTALSIETSTPQTPPSAGNQLVGAMVGNLRGTATSSTGKTVTIDPSKASVSVDLRIITDAAGNLVAHVSGAGATSDGSGVSFRFEADYDVATQALTGTYTDNVNTTPRAIQFTKLSGLEWQAQVTGSAIGSDGASYTYNVTADITLPQQALFAGSSFPADRRFKGAINQTQAISIPVDIPQLGINKTYTTNVVVDGSWEAMLVPTSGSPVLTGTYSGAFRLDPPISFTASVTIPTTIPGVTIPPVSVPINIDAVGRFDGTLAGDIAANTLRFSGSWSAVSSDGAQGGGTMDMTIPLNQQGQLPAQVTTNFSGSFTRPVTATGIPPGSGATLPQTYSTPLTVNASAPFTLTP